MRRGWLATSTFWGITELMIGFEIFCDQCDVTKSPIYVQLAVVISGHWNESKISCRNAQMEIHHHNQINFIIIQSHLALITSIIAFHSNFSAWNEKKIDYCFSDCFSFVCFHSMLSTAAGWVGTVNPYCWLALELSVLLCTVRASVKSNTLSLYRVIVATHKLSVRSVPVSTQ